MSLPVPLDSTNSREHRGLLARAVNAIQRALLPRSIDGATTVITALQSPTAPVRAGSRTVRTTGIPQSATTDIFTFRDENGNIDSRISAAGFFYVSVIDQATGANAFSGVLSFVATGNGGADYVLTGLSAYVVRGATLVSSLAMAADAADPSGGAAKLQILTPASGKTVTATVTFIGQIIN